MLTPYDRAFFKFLEAKFLGTEFRGSPRTSVLKTGRKLSKAQLVLQVSNLAFCIDSTNGTAVLSHS